MARTALVVVLVGLGLGLLVQSIHERDRLSDRRLHRREGRDLVELQRTILTRAFDSVRSDLLYLAEEPGLKALAASSAPGLSALHEDYLVFCEKKRIYDQVRYLDEAGRESIRINHRIGGAVVVAPGDLQDKSSRYYFQGARGLDQGEVYVSAFDLNMERGLVERPLKPVVRFSAPVFEEGGRRRGVVVLNYLGGRLIDELVEVSGSVPGSFMLLDARGHWLRGPTREDEWGFMLGHDRTFAARHPSAWLRISAGGQGQFVHPDGLYTYSSLDYDAGSGARGEHACRLRLVNYLPAAELYARADQLLVRLLWGYIALLGLILAATWFLAYAVAVRRHQTSLIRESQQRLRLLSRKLINAQEEERARLARDLHDDLGQLATTVTLHLQMALRKDGDERLSSVEQALEGVDVIQRRARELASRVRPPTLDELGLEAAVESYLRELEERAGMRVHAELSFQRDPVPTVVGENMYRILLEALNNVVKYAGVQEVFVELATTDSGATLVVRDEGVGFRPETATGSTLGILGMRERVELLGGTFELTSAPGRGTQVRADLPFAAS